MELGTGIDLGDGRIFLADLVEEELTWALRSPPEINGVSP
jgi:hypothetical protein